MSSYASRLAGMGAAALLVSTCVLAENVTWNGVVDMIWTQPDDNSWSGLTYNSGDTPQFTGQGLGTITVNGTLTPGNMTVSASGYTITGDTIAGSGKLTVSSTTVTLANTNTYTGNTDKINGGTLTFRGKDAVSPNTKLALLSSGENRVGNKISLLMDDAGTVVLGNELEMTGAASYDYGTALYEVHVGNNGGSTVGSTIALGKMDFTNPGGNHGSSRLIRSTGANGYKLQFGDVDLNTFFDGTSANGPQGFYSDTAPVIIAGTVKQVVGNSGNTVANYLFLGGTGTTTTNYITGTISDPDDYPANAFAQPLGLKIGGPAMSSEFNAPQSDAIWRLSGENTFTGPTEVKYGTLIIAGGPKGMCLSDTASLTIESNGKLVIQKGSREKVGSLFFGSTEKASGEWGSSASGANNQNDTYFSGEGLLYVGVDIPPLATVLVIR